MMIATTHAVGAHAAPSASEIEARADHGTFSTSWSPEDGGTVHVESREMSKPWLLGTMGTGVAAWTAASMIGRRSSNIARAAGLAGGASALEAARAGSAAGAPWRLAAGALAFGSMIAAPILADRFAHASSTTRSMSREEYVGHRLHDSENGPRVASATESFLPTAVGMPVGLAAGGMMNHALRGASAPVRIGASIATMLGVGLGVTLGVSSAME